MEEFDRRLEEADLVISHGGCTVLSAIRLGKVPVVMPRRKKYGEHVNDHQVQLVQALAEEGRVIPAYEPEDLPGAIGKAMEARGKRLEVGGERKQNRMLELVGKAIEELMKDVGGWRLEGRGSRGKGTGE
jgi:UDP-N-acetylglucosamine:LPS N-acetylglucosamine transferase